MGREPPAQVIVITGASSGIGRSAAHAFAARGARVVLAARSGPTLAEVAGECRERGGRGLAVVTDVSDEAAMRALARRAVAEFGRIDAWVNAAAVWSYARFEDTPGDMFRQIVDTTLFGQIYAARAVLAQFRAQGHGVLVNISSLYGRLSSPYITPYVTSKWGLLGFSEALRQELRDAPGIAVCSILPGAVDTPIYRHAANYVGRDIRPLPPAMDPQRVAAAVVRVVDRPRAETVIGRTHHLATLAHRASPRLYDRMVGPAVDRMALRKVAVAPHEGTVFAPAPQTNAVDDGWRRHDHRVAGKVLAAAVGAAVAVCAAAAGVAAGRRRLRWSASNGDVATAGRVRTRSSWYRESP